MPQAWRTLAEFFESLAQITLIDVLSGFWYGTLTLSLLPINLADDLQPVQVDVAIRIPGTRAGVKFPTAPSVLRLEAHFLGEKIDAGFLVFVQPAHGLRHGFHHPDHHRPVFLSPGTFG